MITVRNYLDSCKGKLHCISKENVYDEMPKILILDLFHASYPMNYSGLYFH